MLGNYFQLGPIPLDQLHGWYDYRLVLLSYIVATFASYIALDITGRLRDITNTQLSVTLWLFGGAIAMGAGIWSMHFIGMLAFNLPMPMYFDFYWTALSMVVAVAASGFALFILKTKYISLTKIIISGFVMGFAIAAMHYTGMAGMEMVNMHFLPSLYILSFVIAVVASLAALWLALKSAEVMTRVRMRLKIVSALIMGAAICGMHYTGMAAAIFTPNVNSVGQSMALNPQLMAIFIFAATFLILSVAFLVSTYKESLNQQLLLNARQAGMAEVAASVLHNVGNVLNSINVSSTLIAENITQSKLSTLEDLNNLLAQHKDDLQTFLSSDTRGKNIPDFINSLTEYWQTEKILLTDEILTLKKNIEHVRNIIATQQDLSRISDAEQVLSIENVLEESLLISAIEEPKYGIRIVKNYQPLNPVLVDKVKLLQILVNLLQNAKESLLEFNPPNKQITITINFKKNMFTIRMADNGTGILQENLLRIFSYGFTTKTQGHGFGLHSSAVTAQDMGGSLNVESAGIGKGAEFILTLPYRQG